MQCEGVLITCEDFRLHQRPDGRNLTAELIKTLGFDCDLVTRAGAILDLVHPEETGHNFDKSVIRDTRVGVKLHQAKKIVVMCHEDCGAYGFLQLPHREARLARIRADMRLSMSLFGRHFPGKPVLLYLALLVPETTDQFKIEDKSAA
jgi:carbonic anhydrase